jgi:hypothetical protein
MTKEKEIDRVVSEIQSLFRKTIFDYWEAGKKVVEAGKLGLSLRKLEKRVRISKSTLSECKRFFESHANLDGTKQLPALHWTEERAKLVENHRTVRAADKDPGPTVSMITRTLQNCPSCGASIPWNEILAMRDVES